MALPQQAAEKLIRHPVHTQGAYRELLMFSSALFVIAIFVYVGLVFGYIPYLASRSGELDGEIERFSREIPAEEQAEIRSFYSALVNLRTVLEGHSAVSPAFGFIEGTVRNAVRYTRVNVSMERREVSLTGIAPDMDEIAAQVATLETDPRVEIVHLRDVAVVEGGRQFNATVILSADAFNETTP